MKIYKQKFLLAMLLFMSIGTHCLWAQSVNITGVVARADGETIPGVSVMVKGTNTTATTDIDGKYSIRAVDSKSVLVFSAIGYAGHEATVGNQAVINVALKEDNMQLEEVVVVGYGVQRKSDVTGAVSKIKASDILETPAFNALQGMKGKVAGVNIFTNSGSPSGSSRVIIRGIGTINNSSNPLYIVDGVAMQDFQFLNPNDIEHIEVLKDASSTAIYGARGANGVVLVTTKRGTKENRTMVSYDGYVNIAQLAKKMDVLNSEQFMEVMKTGFANASKYKTYEPGKEPVFTMDDPRLFKDGKPIYDTDWQKETTRTAVSHNHQLNIQQGTDKSSVGAFLNYSDVQGIMLNSWMKRVNGKLTYDVKAKDWLSFGMNMMVNRTWENEIDESSTGQAARRTMIEMPSIFPVKYPDGTWSTSIDPKDNFGMEAMANPVHVLQTQTRKRERTQIFGNAAFTFHLAQGLDLKTQFGVDQQFRKHSDYSPKDLQNISYGEQGRAWLENYAVKYWQQETFLSYNNTFGDHSINSVLGLSWLENRYEEGKDYTKGFPDDFFKYHNMEVGTIPDPPKSKYERWAMNSYFLRAGYTYKGRYLATLTGRVDGSSKVGANNKYSFFPSLGVGWIISKESFMEDMNAINMLKIRASYGSTGNAEIPIYRSLATISSSTGLLNGERVPTSYTSRLANPDLKWERTNQFDAGFNLSMFNNRLNFEFDYYSRLTVDLLLERPVPYTTGFKNVMDNIGSMSNKGIEMLVNTVNIQTNDFSWETTLSANYNKNKIVKLGDNDEDIFPGPNWVSGSQTILRVGESYGSFWGYERLGTWSTAEVAAEKLKNPDSQLVAGTAKRSAKKTILGKGLPDWTGSFINKLRYKNLDFNLDLQFVMGGNIMQQYFHSVSDRTGYSSGLAETLTEAWTEQNQNTMVQQIRNGPLSGQSSEVDSYWVCDASYLRVNNISLGYTLGQDLLGKFGINKLRIYGSVNNAWVFHSKDFKGFDPEGASWTDQDNMGDRAAQNIFFFQYPKARIFTLGLNLSF